MNGITRAAFAALAILCTLGVPAQAEQEGMPFGAYFTFKTEDPAAVVAAMKTFAASDCRKAMPNSMRLMANMFNGNEPSTHTLIWGNASIQDMQKSFGVFGTCREAAVLGGMMRSASEPVGQFLGMPIVYEGDASKATTFMLWQVTVTDEEAYVKAYRKLMGRMMANGEGPMAAGVIRIVGGRGTEVTHMTYTGFPSLEAQFSGPGDPAAFAEFQKSVSKIRTVQNQSVNFVVADL